MDTPKDTAPTTRRSTRHHRVDEPFLELLEEDFGIPAFDLNASLLGTPPEPKRGAIAICEWAVRVAGGDTEEAGRALRAWARKHGKGTYDPRLNDQEPPTFGGHEARGV